MGLIKKSNPFIGEYRTSKEVVFGILNFHITATQGIHLFLILACITDKYLSP